LHQVGHLLAALRLLLRPVLANGVGRLVDRIFDSLNRHLLAPYSLVRAAQRLPQHLPLWALGSFTNGAAGGFERIFRPCCAA
jgi:hypothetical protein